MNQENHNNTSSFLLRLNSDKENRPRLDSKAELRAAMADLLATKQHNTVVVETKMEKMSTKTTTAVKALRPFGITNNQNKTKTNFFIGFKNNFSSTTSNIKKTNNSNHN